MPTRVARAFRVSCPRERGGLREQLGSFRRLGRDADRVGHGRNPARAGALVVNRRKLYPGTAPCEFTGRESLGLDNLVCGRSPP